MKRAHQPATSRAGHTPPAQPPERGGSQRPKPRRYGRWRAATLIGVYALMAIHIAHWKLAGKTLAPLELNEVMYTLEAGIVTAGFIFMMIALLSVLIFGRFFCSWGCHILALQDLCAWLLKKLNIRPKPVRSRALLLVPVGAMLYMFVWPQVARLIAGAPAPTWRVQGDVEGWASFVTNDFWRNLPTIGVTALTFFICGFAIVYLLGSRSFCTYACPYGAAFAIADRFAIGKIRAVGDRTACEACGLCTAACESHIRVHAELTVFGKVISPACLKDLDCVSVCPNGSITYGFGAPSLFKSWRTFGRFGVPYDFALWEDAIMAIVFLGSVLIFRGLYDAVPFLLSLAIGGIFAWGFVMALRLVTRRDLRFGKAQVKRAGRVTPQGAMFAAAALLATAFTVHSAAVHAHESRGRKLLAEAEATGSPEAHPDQVSRAIASLEFADRWGLMRSSEHTERFASALLYSDKPTRARPIILRLLNEQPWHHTWRIRAAGLALMERRVPEAITHVRTIIAWTDGSTDAAGRETCRTAHQMLGEIAQALGDDASAQREFAAAAAIESSGQPSMPIGADSPSAHQTPARSNSSTVIHP